MQSSIGNPNPQITHNQQQLKLFISVHEEPIPDIINQSEVQQSIYSLFKFYFNDDCLILGIKSKTKDKDKNKEIDSLMHLEGFQEEINGMYRRWVAGVWGKDGEKNKNQQKERNFIAFVEYWVRNSPDLVVSYTVYNEIVEQEVRNFYENTIYKVAFSLSGPQRPFALKQPLKPSQKPRPVPQQPSSLSSPILQKRLHIYFTHFSKLQTISSTSANPLYRNNGSKTFDEIGKIFSTINLQQWIVFVKVFQFDRIFQAKFRDRKIGEGNEGKDKGNQRGYLPVKNVKWSSSLQFFKNLFEKYCDNSKNLGFVAFQNILKKLFQELFVQENQIKPLGTNSEATSPTKPIPSALLNSQKQGILALKLLSEQQFNSKLRSLGIFVPENPTSIPISTHKAKSYSIIKPRYLGLTEPPLMSPKKIQDGKGKGGKSNDGENELILPSLAKKKEKLYTVEGLMTKRDPNKELRNNRDTPIMQASHASAKSHKGSEHKHSKPQPRPLESQPQSYPTPTKLQPQPQPQPPSQTPILKQVLSEIEDEPDQYLSQYYNRDQGYGLISGQKSYLGMYRDKDRDRDNNRGRKNWGDGRYGGQGIIGRLEERMDRINRKML